MNSIDVFLNEVPRTLLLALWGRAELSRQGNRILHDRQAIELVDRLDHDFSRIRADLDFSKNLSWIARARQLDDQVRTFLSRCPEATVVNLGAGLDTTFSRVDNGRLRWIDLDLPQVVELRRQLIPETDRARCLAASLLEPGWLGSISPVEHGLLFLAGGVFFYFPESELIELFRRMGQRFPGAEIVFDAFTPAGVKKANAMLDRVGMTDARLCWGLKDAQVLKTWDAGFELLEQYEYFRGLDLRGLPLGARLMTLANRLLKVMTIVHGRWTREGGRA